jgi:hypothetical protein
MGGCVVKSHFDCFSALVSGKVLRYGNTNDRIKLINGDLLRSSGNTRWVEFDEVFNANDWDVCDKPMPPELEEAELNYRPHRLYFGERHILRLRKLL